MSCASNDLENRRPVWEAMSELYVDTELQEADYARIADVLRSSPYSVSELHRIMYDEVYPVLIANAWSVAGEWAGFDENELEREILGRLSRRWKWPSVLIPGRSAVRGTWNIVIRRLSGNNR